MEKLFKVYANNKSEIEAKLGIENISKIGEGGFGLLFKGTKETKNGKEERAFKLIFPRTDYDLSEYALLNLELKEAFSLSANPHPHIAKLYQAQVFEFDKMKYVCLEMEYYPLGSLDRQEKLSEKLVRQILHQVCSALDFIYSNSRIIHRDIKSSNILVRSISEDQIEVALTDFGLAKSVDSATVTSNSSQGSTDHLAPELLSHDDLESPPPYSIKSDIFAVGITMLSILTKSVNIVINKQLQGKKKMKPSETEYVSNLVEEELQDIEISQELKNIICSMIFKTPDLRTNYSTIFKSLEEDPISIEFSDINLDTHHNIHYLKALSCFENNSTKSEVLEPIFESRNVNQLRILANKYLLECKFSECIEVCNSIISDTQEDSSVIVIKAWAILESQGNIEEFLEAISISDFSGELKCELELINVLHLCQKKNYVFGYEEELAKWKSSIDCTASCLAKALLMMLVGNKQSKKELISLCLQIDGEESKMNSYALLFLGMTYLFYNDKRALTYIKSAYTLNPSLSKAKDILSRKGVLEKRKVELTCSSTVCPLKGKSLDEAFVCDYCNHFYCIVCFTSFQQENHHKGSHPFSFVNNFDDQ